MAQLGVREGIGSADENDITLLRHVRSSAEKRAAEQIADRTPCANFERFQPLFERVKGELNCGERRTLGIETRSISKDGSVDQPLT